MIIPKGLIHNRIIQCTVRLLLTVMLGVGLLSSLPGAGHAQESPIDLVLGSEGATSWNIENIKPCDTGIKTVTLQNAGFADGIVSVWLSDIVSLEGVNPESETGDTSEPGELPEYLMLDLYSGDEMITNLSLPAKISNFPQSALDPDYIRIMLNAGDTVTLSWVWELPCETGNDVQGDRLSFTINYLLEEMTEAPVIVSVHSPEEPCADKGITISAHVIDNAGVISVMLTYDSTVVSMVLTSGTVTDGYWKAEIPGQPAGKTLTFYITVSDGDYEVLSSPYTVLWVKCAAPGGGGPGGKPPSPSPPAPSPTPPEPPPVEPPPEGTIAENGDGATDRLQIDCPADISVYTDPGLSAASNVDLGTPNIYHQDGVVVISNDAPFVFPVGNTVVTWTVTDSNGNKAICTQTVTVIEANCYFDIDMLGRMTRVRISCNDNAVAGSYTASDPDNQHTLEIVNGTTLVCEIHSGLVSYPEIIVMSLANELIAVPDGMAMIGPIYRFAGYKDRNQPDTACSAISFDPPITVTLGYDPNELPSNISSVFVAYYDAERSDWIRLERSVGIVDAGMVAEDGKVTGVTPHLSLFAVMVEVTPSGFIARNLTVVPSVERIGIGSITFVEKVGESVTATVEVANGDDQGDSYDVYLKIDGHIRDTTQVVLGPRQSQEVVFKVTDNQPGKHIAQVSTLSAEFQTWIWINWWLIGGLLGALVLLCILVWTYSRRRRSRRMESTSGE